MGTLDVEGVTQDDVSKLTKAMKDKPFQDLMEEYTKEISDPTHRREYLEYLDQMEAKGEIPEGQQLLRTEPGCCVRTHMRFKNGQTQKCFINVVHSDRLDDLSMTPASGGGQHVHLPYSLSPPRPDRDNKDRYCMTCDMAVSTYTFVQAAQNPKILKMLVDTAAEGLGGQFLKGFEEVKKDFKVLTQVRCKGRAPMPMSVKAELLKDKGTKPTPKRMPTRDAVTPSELKKLKQEAKTKLAAGEAQEKQVEADEARRHEEAERARQSEEAARAPRVRVPKHKLVHSGEMDLTDFMESSNRHTVMGSTIPKSLRLIVELPGVAKSGDISLEVTADNVVVEVPNKYYLDLPLPYEIQDERGGAKFDKAKHTLTLELPVKPKLPDPQLLAMRYGTGLQASGDGDGGLSEGESEEEPAPPGPSMVSPATLQVQAVEEQETRDPVEISEQAVAGPESSAQAVAGPESSDDAVAGPAESAPGGAPLRQQLELGSGLLNFAPDEASREALVAAEDVAPDAVDAAEERVPFIESKSFTGRRAGYYFSTGDMGLGYYLDRRQRQPAPQKVLTGAVGAKRERPDEPLMSEVSGYSAAPQPASASPQPLPRLLGDFVRVTGMLTAALSAGEVEEPGLDDLEEEPPPVQWVQTRQNLTLCLGVPLGHSQVAGVQLSLRGRQLRVSYCTRRSEPRACWRRQEVLRHVALPVDPRQWNAQLVQGHTVRLHVILRKMTPELWKEAFDERPQVPLDEPAVQVAVSTSSAPPCADDLAASHSLKDAPGQAEIATAVGRRAATALPEARGRPVAFGEDSAELDTAEPTAYGSVAGDAPAGGSADASLPVIDEARKQSAMVTGQAVLLRSRMMYMLF